MAIHAMFLILIQRHERLPRVVKSLPQKEQTAHRRNIAIKLERIIIRTNNENFIAFFQIIYTVINLTN